MANRNILQITAHLGGGVGKAILGVSLNNKKYANTTIVLLEKPEKQNVVESAMKKGALIFVEPTKKELDVLIQEADIVIINWWNHPIMSQFLFDFPAIKSRVIIWNHINGCTYPYLPSDFLKVFDYIFFTSKYSYENPYWEKNEADYIVKHSKVILGSGDFIPQKLNKKNDYKIRTTFRIGYVGTLNYSKISKNFILYCEKAAEIIEGLSIALVGDLDEDLKKDIENSNIRDKFELVGYVDNTEDMYLSFDALGYILNDQNYGTTENVILEAMAHGIPVIAHNGGVERCIIDQNKNGFLVNNAEEFANCAYRLSQNPILQKEIGMQAIKKVSSEYNCLDNIKKMSECFEQLYSENKKVHDFKKILGKSPFEWFLYFSGEDRNIFEKQGNDGNMLEFQDLLKRKPIYMGERKSSVRHFYSYYPKDKNLLKLLNEIQGE